jgi:hypothetical protein
VIAAVAVVVAIAAVAFFATRGGGSSEAASTTTTTTRRASTTTTSTTATTLPPDATELVKNDGGQLEVDIPTAWSDHNLVATSQGFPELRASPNLTEFEATTYQQPGVDFAALPASTIDPSDLDAALNALMAVDRGGNTLDSFCTRGQRTEFTPNGSGLSTGLFERLTGCNGGGDVIIIAATDTNLTFTALLEVHLGVPPDDAGVDAATSSFNVVQFP